MSERRALVTGGAGFIGSHLVDELLGCGWRVAVVDDLSSGSRERLRGDARFYRGDVRSVLHMRAVVKAERPQVVFHLAAQSSVAASGRAPAEDAARNVVGTVSVLEAARESDARVVLASTGGAIYGECVRPADEFDEPRPASPYALSKLAAERYVRHYGGGNLVLRYANVYGPRQSPDGEAGVVSIFARALLEGRAPTVFGDGSQTRDFVYVGDVVRATVLAAERGLRGVYNVGTGDETTVVDVLWAMETLHLATQVVGFPRGLRVVFEDARPGDLLRSVVSPLALRRDLGWVPVVGLDEGVRLTYDWTRERYRRRQEETKT